jgi:hypothetical protein
MKTFDRKGILTMLVGMLIGNIIVFIATGFKFTAVLLTLAIEVPCMVVAAIFAGSGVNGGLIKAGMTRTASQQFRPMPNLRGLISCLCPLK